MTAVRIRLESTSPAAIAETEGALRQVLDIPGSGTRHYENRPYGGLRRYVESHGVLADDVDGATPVAVVPPNVWVDVPAVGLQVLLQSAGTATLFTRPAATPDSGRSPLAAAEDAKRARDIAGEVGALQAADRALESQPWMPLQAGDVVLSYLPADGGGPAFGATYVAVGDGFDLQQVSATRFDDVGGPACLPEFRLVDDGGGRWRIDANLGGPDLEQWLTSKGRELGGVQEAQAWATAEIEDAESGREVAGWVEQQDGRSWLPQFDDGFVGSDGSVFAQRPAESFYDLWFESPPDGLCVIREGAVVYGRPAVLGAGR